MHKPYDGRHVELNLTLLDIAMSSSMLSFWVPNSTVISDLLDAGANINEMTQHGKTLLLEFACKEEPSLMPAIFAANIDVNTIICAGETLLQQAILYNPSLVPALLNAGADVNLTKSVYGTPIIKAIYSYVDSDKDLSTIKLLLEHGANVCGKVLEIALEEEKAYPIIPLLLNACDDVNEIIDSSGSTALHHAVLHDIPKITCLLIDKGADTNKKNRRGKTPLNILDEYFQDSDNYQEVRNILIGNVGG